MHPMIDLLTFGEALLRLTPPDYRRLEQSTVLEVHIAGSELNTAVGLARLGLKVRWVSRLTDNVVGRLIEKTLLTQGVDASQIIWTQNDRVGIFYMEEGKAPRASQVTYDRAGSALSRMQLDDLDRDALLQDPPRLLHLTGITLALSKDCASIARHLLSDCQQKNIPLSFDFNYRSRLWSVESARQVCESFMRAASLIFIPARDAQAIYGTRSLEELTDRFPQAAIVMTQGADGASMITPEGEQFHQPAISAEIVCRVGGGDAFDAGFLYAHLKNMPPQMCLRYGNAAAALKYSLPGDLPLFDLQQVIQLAEQPGSGDIQR